MRVLHWAFPFHPNRGGQSIWIERMALASAQRGHQVAIMVGGSTNVADLKSLFGKDVAVIQIGIESTEGGKPNTAHSSKVAVAIEAFQPDVIHVHNLESQEIVHLRLYQATKGKSIPVICTLHDLVSVRRLQKLLLNSENLENFSAVISPSRFVDSHFVSLTPRQRSKFRTINHGVPSVCTGLRDRSGTPKLLFASDLHDHKGGIILLNAWKKLHKEHSDVTLTIAGEGGAKQFLQDYVKLSGLGGHVDFPGWLTQEQLLSILEDDCILVVPSLLGEAFGLIAAEAAMAGAAIIVSQSGALPEIIETGVSGLVVRPNDSSELVDALKSLLMNPKLRSSLGRAAQERAERLFSLDKSVSAYEKVYDEVATRL